jgi:hypothetical protein
MSQVIWKYPLNISDSQTIMMPRGAIIITAQLQHGTPTLWAIVDPEKEKEPRKILIFGTGHEHQEINGVYINTVQQEQYVWHIFEARKY